MNDAQSPASNASPSSRSSRSHIDLPEYNRRSRELARAVVCVLRFLDGFLAVRELDGWGMRG